MNTLLHWTDLIRSKFEKSLNLTWKTFGLRAFALKNIPLIFLVRPTVLKLDDNECEVKIPLNYLTKNHLRSMYIGVLATGADLVAGLLTMQHINKTSHKIQLVFKDIQANFLRRPEADVHFKCQDGKAIQKLIETAIKKKERVHQKLKILAYTPSISKKNPVAEFSLTLSLKVK
ncbi:MAG: DUF4442 domain-containing protein [Deltaproteobacteria bacterium]|nr:DUF4442 domain-containing protein [Deltaproteobacteria bacterium]